MLDMVTSEAGAPSRGVLWVALGRQRVGKTVLLSAAAQFFEARGADFAVWNADQQNRRHAISTFCPGAASVPSGGIEAAKRWIEGRLVTLMASGGSAMLDIGGGFTGFSALTEDVPLVESLNAAGIEVVAFFVIGPEQADLDHLEQFASAGQFMPRASVVVLNAALVRPGLPPEDAFAPILAHSVVRGAIANGSKVVEFPNLACLSAVADQGLRYEDVLAGRYRSGQKPLGPFDLLRVRRWWRESVPRVFGELPETWLPGPVVGVSQGTV